MRGSIASEPEDFYLLNAALLGPPKPNSVLQSVLQSVFAVHYFVAPF